MQLYLSQAKTLIQEDTEGVRVDSYISVRYFDKVVATTKGFTQRAFVLNKGVPAYIYLAAGAGGTILFLLVTFALFKCGFFKRKTKDKLKKLKRQTMQNIDANALLMLDASISGEPEAQEIRDDSIDSAH